MKRFRPIPGETTSDVLRRSVGGLLLLNVTVDDAATSVCVNIETSGSAAWREKYGNRGSLNLESPAFSLTEHSLVLSYGDVNALGNNFHVIWEAIPANAVTPNGRVAVGNLSQNGAEMDHMLVELEHRSDDIKAICDALENPLNTELRSLPKPSGSVRLMNGSALSDYAGNVLSAFLESQRFYAGLPVLRGFGTENLRGLALPNQRGALLRYHMQHNPADPLRCSRPLAYVTYELKPLNISGWSWNCTGDPRTESVDLLMSMGGSPVFIEVKMKGDTSVSAAVVQLLYYASILANDKQKERLAREIEGFTSQVAWLCVIAEQRNDAGFANDLGVAVSFLHHHETRKALGPFFGGAAVLVIEEAPEQVGNPYFQMLTNGEHFIEWRS
jgi:hypothetical protein